MDSPVIRHAKLRALNDKGHWIQAVVESPSFKKGAFTKKAKRAGRKTKAYMSEVLRHPDDFDPITRRQAQFMRNILPKTD
jgi:hypothetical protein